MSVNRYSIREYQKKWRQKNPEKTALYCVDRPDILNGRGGIDCYIGNDRILSISYQLGNRTLKADALKILEEYIGRSQKLIDAGTKFISPYPSGNAFQ